jgi:hypothetical protein
MILGNQFDLHNLRIVTCTGAVLSADVYEWFYKTGFPKATHLISMSGGTDIAGCCKLSCDFVAESKLTTSFQLLAALPCFLCTRARYKQNAWAWRYKCLTLLIPKVRLSRFRDSLANWFAHSLSPVSLWHFMERTDSRDIGLLTLSVSEMPYGARETLLRFSRTLVGYQCSGDRKQVLFLIRAC